MSFLYQEGLLTCHNPFVASRTRGSRFYNGARQPGRFQEQYLDGWGELHRTQPLSYALVLSFPQLIQITHLIGCIFSIISSFRFSKMKSNTFKTLQEQMKFHRHLFSFHLSFFYFSLHFWKVKMYSGNWVRTRLYPWRNNYQGKKITAPWKLTINTFSFPINNL